MNRIKLRNGGKPRRKAFLGSDGAITAAATLAAAGITSAATTSAAKSQAKAIAESAKTQAQSIKDQTINSNNLQRESISFTRQQNQENRQQQQDIQTTLQILAGQENMNDRMEANKVQVRMGGRPKFRSLKSTPSYGGAGKNFTVTDGGGVIPVSVNSNGYGLYELYGNDHEHYHKTKGGKNKTGVGIKFNDGSVVEGEGNQNSNQGELLYVTPNDAMFISKHSIDGFNPTQAVKSGVHPIDAFNTQEYLKAIKGLNDDGTKVKRKSNKALLGGVNPIIDQANMTQNPSNGTSSVSAGVAYGVNTPITSPIEDHKILGIAKNGKRVHLKCGGRRKAAWGDYAGATYNAAGNLIGAGISTWGNMYSSKKLGNAYIQAGNILADAYSQMKGIDLNEVSREDYAAPHTMAVVRSANTNINPQLERIRRNAAYERREINRGTISSAARQQRLAATNDRMFQRMGEQYAYKQNADEQIKQRNAESITQTAAANADRDVQASREWGNQRLSLLQYNNNIENARTAGMAQARADAITQSAGANALAFQNSMNAIGSAIANTGQGFASAYNVARKEKQDFMSTYVGLGDAAKVTAAINRGDSSLIQNLYIENINAGTEASKQHAAKLEAYMREHNIPIPRLNINSTIQPKTNINLGRRGIGLREGITHSFYN